MPTFRIRLSLNRTVPRGYCMRGWSADSMPGISFQTGPSQKLPRAAEVQDAPGAKSRA